MEIETMRRILAETIGWALYTDATGASWLEPPDRPEIPFSDWHPWDNWPQAGMVIEEMRAAGWRDTVNDAFYPEIKAAWYHIDHMFRFYSATANTEPHARMLAAARALESEANDGA